MYRQCVKGLTYKRYTQFNKGLRCANILNEPYQNAMMGTYVSAILYAVFDRENVQLQLVQCSVDR